MTTNTERLNTIRDLYNDSNSVWPSDDLWHNYTKTVIESKVYSWITSSASDMILNAGSGGTEYDILGTMVHLDIAEKKIKPLPKYIIGSVEDIPSPDNTYDYVICVGSVLNYVPLFPTLNELYRVLKPGGKLLLEFERSNSGGLLLSNNYGKKCVFQKYNYNGQEHGIWLYSEKLIKDTLEVMGLRVTKLYRFHSFSSLCARVSNNMEIIIKTTKMDPLSHGISSLIAHNCIILFEKATA